MSRFRLGVFGRVSMVGVQLWGSRRNVKRTWQREREPQIAQQYLIGWDHFDVITRLVVTDPLVEPRRVRQR
jgi:hypothetical protein